MSTIPASQLVNIVPGVLGTGGSAIDVIGLMLTESTRPPIGSVLSFSDAASVSTYFGAASQEAALAVIYFKGFEGSTKKPASILAAQYPGSAVAAFLRGGNISAMTLAALNALNGAVHITVDGYARNASSVDLSGAASFTAAAATIQTALNAAESTLASFTGAISTTVLTVSAFGSGAPLAVGQAVHGAGVTAGTVITALGSGTGGTGTYTVNHSQTVGSEALTTTGADVAVTYDSTSGGFLITSGITGVPSTIGFASTGISANLLLTSATGAVLSQGAAAAAPATFMDGVVAAEDDWVTFFTTFDPDVADANSVKEAFADWTNGTNDRYAYLCWDLDQSPVAADPAASSLGQLLTTDEDSGTALLDGDTANGWDATTAPELAAMVSGAAASINFNQTKGRITFAYKSQSGMTASVVSATAAVNLGGNPQTGSRGNGYNFYGAYGSANTNLVDFQRGLVTGRFLWLDSYINQIWLNNILQAALLNLLANTLAVPFNAAGNSLVEAALADPIQAGLNFGAFAPGTISSAQAAAVDAAAGASVSGSLQSQGWYLQVVTASSTVRTARGPLQVNFFYLDRGSVQSINVSSVAVL